MRKLLSVLLVAILCLGIVAPAVMAGVGDDCTCNDDYELKNGVWRPKGSGGGGGAAGAGIAGGAKKAAKSVAKAVKKADEYAEIGWKWVKRFITVELGRRTLKYLEKQTAPDFARG